MNLLLILGEPLDLMNLKKVIVSFYLMKLINKSKNLKKTQQKIMP